MSLNTALTVAASGLTTTSREMDVVAANIANADTVGYTKKTLARQDSVHEGQTGSVFSVGTQRTINALAQKQFWTETGATEYSSTINNFLAQVDKMFGKPGSSTALDSNFNNFSQSLQALAANPDDQTARLDVLNKANLLSKQLNNSSQTIQALRQDAEYRLDRSVDDLNGALKDIERLDHEIRQISLSGEQPAGLMDQRDRLISQVSGLVGINVEPVPGNSVKITTVGGISLYDEKASEFRFDPNTKVSAETNWDRDPAKRELGSLVLSTPNGNSYDVTKGHGFSGGAIGALIELRDETLPEAQAQLDELAAGMAKAFSTQEVAGTAETSGAQEGFSVDLAGLQDGDTITLTYTDTATGDRHTVSFVKVGDSGTLPLGNDVTARTDDKVVGIDFSSGMAGVVAQIQAELGGNFTVSNPAGSTLTILDDGAAGAIDIDAMSAQVTATGLQDSAGAVPLFVDAGIGHGIFSGKQDGVPQKVGFAGRIAVNPDLVDNPNRLVQFAADTGSADQTRPTALFEALSQTKFSLVYKDGGEPAQMTIKEFSRHIISYQAEQSADAKTRLEGQQIVMNNVQVRVEAGSKVKVDDELARLLELQTAYSANARVMSAVREMMDALMRV